MLIQKRMGNLMSDWWIFKGDGNKLDTAVDFQKIAAPSWRKPKYREAGLDTPPNLEAEDERGNKYETDNLTRDLVNAAILLRRPLLITGNPGSGKSSLAYAITNELRLGPVLKWSITTRTTLQDGLYRYDAIARLHDASMLGQEGGAKPVPNDIGKYIILGPLGTALLHYTQPRVLLIDEIDKSDIDLPNDLLNVFEEGEFDIPELLRLEEAGQPTVQTRLMPFGGKRDSDRVQIEGGTIRAKAFPIVIMTSNNERDFPPAFLRRCLRLDILPPDETKLARIVDLHFKDDLEALSRAKELIKSFMARASEDQLATDQLLNAIFLMTRSKNAINQQELIDVVFRALR
jgi:MoxR-like ATPase